MRSLEAIDQIIIGLISASSHSVVLLDNNSLRGSAWQAGAEASSGVYLWLLLPSPMRRLDNLPCCFFSTSLTWEDWLSPSRNIGWTTLGSMLAVISMVLYNIWIHMLSLELYIFVASSLVNHASVCHSPNQIDFESNVWQSTPIDLLAG
jgi:hypothetical protein